MAGECILIVEDDKDILDVLCMNLSKEGYQVTQAGTLEAALAAMAKVHFDLLLTDNCLPDGLGIDLIQQLRQASLNPEILAILMTGGLEMEGWDDEMIADSLLPKPFSLSELKVVVGKRLAAGGKVQSLLQYKLKKRESRRNIN